MTWFTEKLHADYQLELLVAKTLYRRRTDHQDLFIFENPSLGRVLALDGVIQTTEGDEFIYHEMLAHVPALAHGGVRRVLVVGGGDGGMLKQVLKHGVERVTQVELDARVVELSRRYLPSLSAGAFDDPRTELVIGDGARFVAETDQAFDLIIVDSTDPIGPGEILFGAEFYADCKRRLADGGILVTQNGVPFLQADVMVNSFRRLRPLFTDVTFFVAPIPTYGGGFMTFGWATMDEAARRQPRSVIEERYAGAGLKTRYYNPDVHVASFALPNYIRALMA